MIDFHSFASFCKGLEGKMLPTAGGRAKFELTLVQNDCFSYTPLSTGKIRDHRKIRIERVLARYAAIKSLHSKDYKETFNGPCILALIKLYMERQSIKNRKT